MRIRIAFGFVASLLNAVVACAATETPRGVALDGVWKGKTSQDREISLTVKDGAIVSATYGWSLKLPTPCADNPTDTVALDYRGASGTSTYLRPIPIEKNAFVISDTSSYSVKVRISGSFSKEAVSGEMSLTKEGICPGDGKATWTAKKEAPPVAKRNE